MPKLPLQTNCTTACSSRSRSFSPLMPSMRSKYAPVSSTYGMQAVMPSIPRSTICENGALNRLSTGTSASSASVQTAISALPFRISLLPISWQSAVSSSAFSERSFAGCGVPAGNGSCSFTAKLFSVTAFGSVRTLVSVRVWRAYSAASSASVWVHRLPLL